MTLEGKTAQNNFLCLPTRLCCPTRSLPTSAAQSTDQPTMLGTPRQQSFQKSQKHPGPVVNLVHGNLLWKSANHCDATRYHFSFQFTSQPTMTGAPSHHPPDSCLGAFVSEIASEDKTSTSWNAYQCRPAFLSLMSLMSLLSGLPFPSLPSRVKVP